VLANKFLFILLLRPQNLIMLVLLLLYLAAIFLSSVFKPGGD